MNTYKLLSDIADIYAGFIDDKTHNDDEGIRYGYIQPNNISENGVIKNISVVYKKEKVTREKLVRDGDVIIKRLNSNIAAIAENTFEPTMISQNLFIIRPKKAVVSEYLACLFEQPSILSQIEHLSGSAAVIKTISVKKLMNIEVPIISIKQQKAIGALWKLSKKRKYLLKCYIEESDKLFYTSINQFVGI